MRASRLQQVLATGCGGTNDRTGERISTPCGVALLYGDTKIVIATNKYMNAFSTNTYRLASTTPPKGWQTVSGKAPHGVGYAHFYEATYAGDATEQPVPVETYAVAKLGMYPYVSEYAKDFKSWQTEVCKSTGCTSALLFKSY